MLEQQVYELDDPAEIRSLIDRTGWATLVTGTSDGQLVVSHLPVILDPESPDPAVLSHLPRGEVAAHEFGEREVVLIVEGPRLRPTRVVAKAKLSQDKPLPIIERVITALDNDPHYRNPDLAEAMRRHPPGHGS